MTNVKQEIRKVFRWLQANAVGEDEHGNNAFNIFGDKKYFVGKMSYDEWYIEPYRKGRTEAQEFDENTLWEKSDTMEILQMFVDRGLIEVKAK